MPITQITSVPTGDFPDPITQPTIWDTVNVQGVPWSGRIRFKGAKLSHNWDQKHGRDTQGATDSYVGIKPKEFTLTFFLWTAAQFQYWGNTYAALFQYDGAKGTARASSIYHPSLSIVGITAVICLDLGAPETDDGDMWHADVTLRQFRPPVASPAVTPAGKTNSSNPEPNRDDWWPYGTGPHADQQALLGKLLAQVGTLGTPGGEP
jgi:hypothetical protein